jgi:hypothetical protein
MTIGDGQMSLTHELLTVGIGARLWSERGGWAWWVHRGYEERRGWEPERDDAIRERDRAEIELCGGAL